MNNSIQYYSVGALLYCPAGNAGIAGSLISQQFGNQFSLALCLEDTINDDCVTDAENQLVHTIKTLFKNKKTRHFFIPRIFIRVRESKQIPNLLDRLNDAAELVTGFIIPKFSLDNADEYIETIVSANRNSNHTIYMMPILESPDIINLHNRYDILYRLKKKLDSVEEFVLNIRVGGNDLCHRFGFRRHSDESIHRIRPVSNIFSDIITVFGMDYVVSGPVWEYYNGDNWDTGLKNELQDDRLCGFIGKTVIHPKQIALVNEAYKVSRKDLDDAKSILNWDTSSGFFVSGSVSRERMNEFKTHSNWAARTLILAEAFGVLQDICK